MKRILTYFALCAPLYLIALAAVVSFTEPVADVAIYMSDEQQQEVDIAAQNNTISLPAELQTHSMSPMAKGNKQHTAKYVLKQWKNRISHTQPCPECRKAAIMASTARHTVLPFAFTLPKQHYVYTLRRLLC